MIFGNSSSPTFSNCEGYATSYNRPTTLSGNRRTGKTTHTQWAVLTTTQMVMASYRL
ncbi:hypothetical protein CANTEDRAFT_113767, partial [Yamadazyma tenuis ATCC 10573]